jgi:hypothetical protein
MRPFRYRSANPSGASTMQALKFTEELIQAPWLLEHRRLQIIP